MFQPFLALLVYSLPCIKFNYLLFLSLMSSISIYFKQLKHFWLFLDLLENEDGMSGKKCLLVLPSPSSKQICIRPHLKCRSIDREQCFYVLVRLINEPESSRQKYIFVNLSCISCLIYII